MTSPTLRTRSLALLIRRRVLVGVLIGLLLLATVLGLTAWLMVRQAPAWWRSIDPDDPGTQDVAQDVERGVSSLLSRRRPPDEHWAFRITAAQADAWLNVRLPRWLRNQDETFVWPDTLSQLQVHFADERMHIGLIQKLGARDQILTATLTPTLRDGLLWCELTSMGAGQLPLPAGTLLDKLERSARGQGLDPEDLDAVFEVLRGERGLPPQVELDDGRLVTLVDLTLEDGDLIGTCITQWSE
jgi:hypothetical protein